MRWMTFFWCWVVCCCCSVTQSCLTLHDPMDCSMPDFPVLHYLLELAQTHVHWVNDTISSSVNPFFSCPQFFPASESFQMSQSFQVAKVLEFQLQHQSFQWTPGLISFRMDWLDLLAGQGRLKSLLQYHGLKASILWRSAFFIVQYSHP